MLGGYFEIVVGRLAEETSQTAAHKTLFPEVAILFLQRHGPRQRDKELGLHKHQNLSTCCFFPYAKHASACIFKTVMAPSNCSNRFGSRSMTQMEIKQI
jgi:hypothetical protein